MIDDFGKIEEVLERRIGTDTAPECPFCGKAMDVSVHSVEGGFQMYFSCECDDYKLVEQEMDLEYTNEISQGMGNMLYICVCEPAEEGITNLTPFLNEKNVERYLDTYGRAGVLDLISSIEYLHDTLSDTLSEYIDSDKLFEEEENEV